MHKKNLASGGDRRVEIRSKKGDPVGGAIEHIIGGSGRCIDTDRMLFHASPKLEEMITEINLAVKPSLTVIDGTKSFTSGGPFKGTVAESKVYLASTDILAADVVGVGLLKNEGAKLRSDNPWDSRQIKRALELGLSPLGKDKINQESAKVI